MIYVYTPSDVGTVVAFVPWSVLHVLFGVYVTVYPVPRSSIASYGGCGMTPIVIVLSFTGYLIFCMINTTNIFEAMGVGIGLLIGVGWLFKVAMRYVLLNLIFLSMCCDQFVPQLSLLTGDYFSVGAP